MSKKKKSVNKNKFWATLGLALLGLVAIGLLVIPNLTIDANTPEWLADLITNTTAFNEMFDPMVVILVFIAGIGGLLLYKSYQNKENKPFFLLALAALILYGLYILLMPGLAEVFSDQAWLVDFSTHAHDVHGFIADFQGALFFAIALVVSGVIYYRSLLRNK
ncbi:hypothetical protein JV173_01470 [Acholeplasma equirhinis]|uniref:hypothetical protein n=1 Tax=Acholeplasma equirhinis TaxID=555393 RepID=UPI00197AD5B0|nr:hypothetical protein [Acholeplasma equirhinis]MBN3490173.1 hypothetical protein [Acholeplasma equirhinis]